MSKINRKIVMKKTGCRHSEKSFNVYQGITRDLFLENNTSNCCKAVMIRIAGDLKCTKCDNYCDNQY